MGKQHGKRKGKEKKRKGKERTEGKQNQSMLTGSLHYCTLLSKEFLLFFTMPIFVETVTPIRTTIAICLMISLAVYTLEDMRTWLPTIGSCLICFLVFHVTPHFLSVVFSIVSSIALRAPGDMRATAKCRMSPLPTVFTLLYSWVHVSSMNGCNKLSNIELLIDDVLHIRTALGISDIHPNYCFIQLG